MSGLFSQVRGSVIIDVNSNQPVDMQCPYICPTPYICLFNNSTTVLSAASNYEDTVNMGTLMIRSLSTINSVNSVATPVSIYVYAWMENVVLGCPTGTQIEITSESDERVVGPVERISTSIAQWADKLSAIPEISPFAVASSMVAKGIAGFASIFGWSYPTINTAPVRMKPSPFQNAANLIGYDTGHRITMDPKQELTVDPSVVAVNEDELAINYITSKQSLMAQFNWSPSNVVNVPVWRAVVNPRAYQLNVQTIRTYHQPTALAYAATPFQYWRGTLKYRIEIVASKFHRGKYAIFYEPNVSQSTLISSNFSLNKQFLAIVDIQDTQCIEFDVEWSRERHWKEVLSTSQIATSVATTGTFGGTGFNSQANGFISFVPINPVRSPDGSSVQVNVFVSSDDIVFNQPTTDNLPTTVVWSESMESVCPAGMTNTVLDVTSPDVKSISLLHFGEVPASFRSLLKRFAPLETGYTVVDNGATTQGLNFTSPIIPRLLPDLTTNATLPTLLNYLRGSFLGLRGGLRRRSWVTGIGQSIDRSVVVTLAAPTGTQPLATSHVLNTIANVNAVTLRGNVMFKPATNAGIEYEVPFYTTNLFGFSGQTDPFPVTETTIEANAIRRVSEFWEIPSGITSGAYNTFVATGEDFTLLRFIASSPFSVIN